MNLDPFGQHSAWNNCFIFLSKHLRTKNGSGSGGEKIKEKISLLVKPTTAKQTAFGTTLVPSEIFRRTRELIVLMSPAAEPILYPPELKVTPGTTHGSIAVRLAPELHRPSRGLDPCNNPIKAPSDNKWAAAELNSGVYM